MVEELDPFIEEAVKLMGIPCEGKKHLPADRRVRPAGRTARAPSRPDLLPGDLHVALSGSMWVHCPRGRPSCAPAARTAARSYVLNKLKVPVNGDIGCYTLGLIPPLSAIHTCGCMGAGIAVAHGAAKAGSPERHVAVIGDSTFFHTGIPALVNVVYNQSPVVTIIMDNRVTGMTGHRRTPAPATPCRANPRRGSSWSRWCGRSASSTSRPCRLTTWKRSRRRLRSI